MEKGKLLEEMNCNSDEHTKLMIAYEIEWGDIILRFTESYKYPNFLEIL